MADSTKSQFDVLREKRIAIDGRLLTIGRGIGNATFNTLRALSSIPIRFELIVYVTSDFLLKSNHADDSIDYRILPNAPYPIWENRLIPNACIRDGIQLLHSPGNTGPFVLSHSIRRVTTVHDLIYFAPRSLVPQPRDANQKLQRLYYRSIVPHAARSSDAIITDSIFSRDELVRIIGLPEDRIHVVPLGVTPNPARDVPGVTISPAGRHQAEPYAFALGAKDPRKNSKRLVEAFARARKSEPRVGSLVIAGLADDARGALARVASRAGCEKHVTLLGFVSPKQLAELYRRAYVFIYPSLYEGFGLPVLEAMAAGVAVIASSTTSVPEVCGDAALLVDPRDVEAIASALSSLARQPSCRAELVRRGTKRVGAFPWIRTARGTVDAYRSAFER